MAISHTMFSKTNHEDAIARELNWLLTADPLWSSATNHDCVPLKKICKGSVEEIAKNLSNEWAWYGAPKRLGRRFESLLTAMLEQSDACKLLKHGLVVQDKPRQSLLVVGGVGRVRTQDIVSGHGAFLHICVEVAVFVAHVAET